MSEPEKKPAPVPKFSSFKPKTAPSEISRDKSRHRDRSRHGRDRSKDRHRGRDKDKERHRSGSARNKDRDRSRDRDRKHREGDNQTEPSSRHRHTGRHEKEPSRSHETRPSTSKPKSSTPKPANISGQDFFVIDTKGDSLIHLGLDRYSIPNFGRQKRKYLLGTTARLYMHYDGPYEQFSLLQPGEFYGQPPLRNKKLTFSMTKPLKAATGKRPRDEQDMADIIYVAKRQKLDQGSSDEELEPDFRSITGKLKPKYYSDSDESDEQMLEDLESTNAGDNPLKTRSIELSRRVKSDPRDIPSWIALIDLQESLLRSGISPDDCVSDNHIRSTADITLSMIDKALKTCTHPKDHEALLLRQMYHGRKVWSPDALRKRWANIASSDYGARFALWMARVEFNMTDATDFSYGAIRKMYVERLQSLMEKAQRYQVQRAGELYAEAVYVFLRMTRFIHDAGYREGAVAAWQAFIEVNFFRPAAVSGLDAFADFWESEVLRVGEPGARGWAEYVALGESGNVPEPKEDGEKEAPRGKNVYESWALHEMDSAAKGRMPARTMDDGTGDDPLRLVMASDLEGLLLQFPESCLPELQEQMIDSLLVFSHLEPVFKSSPWIERALNDPFLAPVDLSVERLVNKATHGLQEKTSNEWWFMHSKLFPGMLPEFVWSLHRKWDSETMSQAPVDFSWVRNTLHQLSTGPCKVSNLLSYVMALDWLVDGSSIRSTARKIIQTDPTNPELYRLYAAFEWQNGNPDISAKVFSSAVALKRPLPANPAISQVSLDWVWMDLVEGSSLSRTLSRLCAVLDGLDGVVEVSNTRLLSAKQSLSKSVEIALSLGDVESFGIVSKALVLLAYVSESGSDQPQNLEQGNISAAITTFWVQFTSLSSLSVHHGTIKQDLCAFAASLLSVYASRGPYQRAFLNANIKRCLQAFPRHVFLIELLEYVNAGHLFNSAFHDVAQNLLLAQTNDCTTTRVCLVAHDLRRGTVHLAQAALERSIAASWEIQTASVGLWRIYMQLCDRTSELKQAACETYYRALSRCPWSRDAALDAFIGMARKLEEIDLQAAFEGMANKGLRIHTDLDEYIEQSRVI